MKPRYSIRGLLAFTATVAAFLAAMLYPLSMWDHAWFVVWLMGVAYFAAAAFDPVDRSAKAFGRTALACGAIYLILPHLIYGANSNGISGVVMEQWSIRFGSNPAATYEFIYPRYTLIHLGVSLAFGLFGGQLALWRYRRQARVVDASGSANRSDAAS